jgi:hypothetical protein
MVMAYFTVIYSFGNAQESQEVHYVRRLITRLRFDRGAFNVEDMSVTTNPVYSMSYLSLSSNIMHLVKKKLSCCTGISRIPVPLFSPITVGVMFAKRLIHARIAPPPNMRVTWLYADTHVPSAWSTQFPSTSFLLNGPKSQSQQETWACFVWTFELHTNTKR